MTPEDVEVQHRFKAWCDNMPNSYEEALHFMHETAPGLGSAIALTDRYHQITDVNYTWELLCGYSPEEVKGRTFRFMQGAHTDVNILLALNQCLQRGEAVEVVIVNYAKDGREFYNHLLIKPLYSGASSRGEVTHYLGELRDVGNHLVLC